METVTVDDLIKSICSFGCPNCRNICGDEGCKRQLADFKDRIMKAAKKELGVEDD